MNNKCDKYESLFIFGSKEDFSEHLKTCTDCQNEHEQMKKVACVVKEVKPFITNKENNVVNFPLYSKIVACFIMPLIFSFAFNLFSPQKANPEIAWAKQSSVVTEMGLPSDEFGLLTIEQNND